MRVALVVVAVLVVLIGAVFAGQGLGYIPGSVMTGDMKWFWIGGAMVLVGLALGVGALRRTAKRT
ncbi:MAG: hypothetical protein E6I81_14585 [Chloroflexi bacterium]|nr:MAG: hypothetical protein E6I81_14585 [Chloroflexota bacterium]